MQNTLFSKEIIFAIIILFIGVSLIPSTVSLQLEKNNSIDKKISSYPVYLHNTTIYVDDDNAEGPWDGTLEHPFRYVKDGVNAADDNDTVFVFSGTYYETYIVVKKSIKFFGEDKDSTIIDGGGYGTVFSFYANNIMFTGFTVQNGGNDYFAFDSGIKVGKSSNVTIIGNIISNNRYIGLFVYAHKCLVSQNTITSNIIGILVFPDPKGNNMIFNNTVDSNCVGIDIAALNVSIFRNKIRANLRGIRITESINISIFENNFRRNENPPIFAQSDRMATKWKSNYWNRPRLFPKLIFGRRYLEGGKTIFWINFDWHPAKEPYDIEV